MSIPENSIIFGRRGTGKTHLLRYLAEQRVKAGDHAVYIDLRTIGSNGGLYDDANENHSKRAVTLIIDVLQSIHNELLELAFSEENNLGDVDKLINALDNFIDAASRTRVSGQVTVKSESSSENKTTQGISAKIEAELKALKLSGSVSNELYEMFNAKISREENGTEEFHIIYPDINNAMKKINEAFGKSKCWILIDEWAEIPQALQPYLADMIKKVFFPHKQIIIKIGAIENRSQFSKVLSGKQIIGIEQSADAASHLSLDEFMVFDNDEAKSKQFFENLIHKHAMAIDTSGVVSTKVQRFSSQAFTQGNAVSEFARASEGVARDALNIISEAALKADDEKISVPIIRKSAKDCYIRGKKSAIENKDGASDLLNWIIDEVIKKRSAKAFMLEVGVKDPLIEFLFDNRALHIIKQNVSSQDIPGKRFYVYSIDYGCYVDLIHTANNPKALLFDVDQDGNEEIIVDVPKSDYRSIRRSILDLKEFYENRD